MTVIEPFAVQVPRDLVQVRGPDAVSFLQGQLSQEISALPVNGSAWSFLLQPQGKVDAWLRVSRMAEDEVVLDVDGGFGAAVMARLDRFKLRTKADIEALPWVCIGVRGTTAVGPHLTVDPAWPGVAGVDLLGPEAAMPDGIRAGTIEEYEALRIECGIPAMGRELTDRTIPAEAGVVERSVSFTKGCYTGQELVARIDSRGGNVPRRLRGLVLEGATIAEPGDPVLIDGIEVGVVTSAALSSRFGGSVALAYVKRDVEPPATGRVGDVVTRIEALPLVRSRA
jgi:folate-binding protein YgfZ